MDTTGPRWKATPVLHRGTPAWGTRCSAWDATPRPSGPSNGPWPWSRTPPETRSSRILAERARVLSSDSGPGEILRRSGGDPEALLDLAEIFRAGERYEDSLPLYGAAIEEDAGLLGGARRPGGRPVPPGALRRGRGQHEKRR